MADAKRVYQIEINGIKETTNAVDSLNKQLDALEKKINALQSKSVNIGTSSTSTKGGSKSALTEEEKLARQIEQIDAKREAYSKKIYQNYMAAKDVLKETVNDQKQIAASERLQANNYTNTMRGLKEKLADIKNVMQTTDIGSDLFKKYTQEANALTEKLKQLEEAYGQFGRNVGNYKSAADGFKQLEITVNGVVRTFNNAREAYKTLKNERDTMALQGQRETKQFKELDETVKTLASDIKDMSKSSATMDNILDTMTSFSAMASVGVGLTQLFGFDDQVFSDSMKKLTSLLLIVKSFETLAEQWQSNEGLMGKIFKPMSKSIDEWADKAGTKAASNFFDKFSEQARKDFAEWANDKSGKVPNPVDEIYSIRMNKGMSNENVNESGKDLFDYWDTLTEKQQEALYVNHKLVNETIDGAQKIRKGYTLVANAVKFVGKALLTLGGIFATFAISELLDKFTDFVKSLNTAKIAADAASQSMSRLNNQFEEQRDALGASYMKGEISDIEYVNTLYQKQAALLAQNIELLKEKAKANEYNGLFGSRYMSDRNTEFSGEKFKPTTVGAGAISSMLGLGNDLKVTVKNIEEVEKAWKHCFDAVKQEKDAWDDGSGIFSRAWWGSLVTTVKDTEKVMKGMGNIKLSDFINQFGELDRQFKNSEISIEEYAKGVARLKKEMNSNEVLSSVIANLDKYIPDEEVRKDVQSIIDKIRELNGVFNETTAEQVHHWNQVRIDAMKDGLNKTLAQIKENQRYELQQEGVTEEQRNLIKAKYRRQELDAQEKAGKEALAKQKELDKKLIEADNQLIALRIANMKEGFDKRMKELENQRRLELQKLSNDAKDNKFIKVQEMTLEINKKYDKLVLDEKRKWAFETLKVYEDLAARIEQLNEATMQTEAATATQNVETRGRKQQESAGYSMITPTTYDDSKELEKYYAKVVEIKKEAAEKELQIERERLAMEVDFQKKEEELRHSRLVNADGGEYITQLRAGLISQEQYDKLIEDENDAHYARMNAIDKQYASNLSAVTQDTLEEEQKLYSDYYGNIINNLRSDKAKIDEIMSKQPVTDKQGWGVVNTKQTSANYQKALDEYEKIRQEIVKKQSQLRSDLNEGRISPEAFAMRQKEIDQEMKAIDNATKNVRERQKQLIADFMQSIQQYIQAGVQSFQDIMSAVWTAQDNNFEKEQEELDKLNDELDKKLDKQREIIEEHTNSVNSLEDELANSRGSRRQHLIDQINAEIAAQRAAQAEEKKIQKEKEAAQKKQDKLELKRKKAQYKRDQMQAIVNGAMAVTYAAINTWPVPAVPMMALAAATTAAQLAIMAANKPYAKGGVLEGGVAVGKLHRDGGIPVLGGRASIEGGEYITDRMTTAKNVDLLDYINGTHKKLDLDDFIDFYSSGKAKKRMTQNSPKRVFADGGIIPTLTNDYDINNRLITAFESYNNRPVVVSVVDINNRQAAVRNVRVLAGLSE